MPRSWWRFILPAAFLICASADFLGPTRSSVASLSDYFDSAVANGDAPRDRYHLFQAPGERQQCVVSTQNCVSGYFCNHEFGDTGNCQSCAGIECPAQFDDRTTCCDELEGAGDEECTVSTQTCDEGQFCNHDFNDTGHCQLCVGTECPRRYDDDRFPCCEALNVGDNCTVSTLTPPNCALDLFCNPTLNDTVDGVCALCESIDCDNVTITAAESPCCAPRDRETCSVSTQNCVDTLFCDHNEGDSGICTSCRHVTCNGQTSGDRAPCCPNLFEMCTLNSTEGTDSCDVLGEFCRPYVEGVDGIEGGTCQSCFSLDCDEHYVDKCCVSPVPVPMSESCENITGGYDVTVAESLSQDSVDYCRVRQESMCEFDLRCPAGGTFGIFLNESTLHLPIFDVYGDLQPNGDISWTGGFVYNLNPDDDLTTCANLSGLYDVVVDAGDYESIVAFCNVTRTDTPCEVAIECIDVEAPFHTTSDVGLVVADGRFVLSNALFGYIIESMRSESGTNVFFDDFVLREFVPCGTETSTVDCGRQGFYCNDDYHPEDGRGRCDFCWLVKCQDATEQETERCCEIPDNGTLPAPEACDNITGGYHVAATTDLEEVVEYCRVRPLEEMCQFDVTCTRGHAIGYISNSSFVTPILNINGTSDVSAESGPHLIWDNGFTYMFNPGMDRYAHIVNINLLLLTE